MAKSGFSSGFDTGFGVTPTPSACRYKKGMVKKLPPNKKPVGCVEVKPEIINKFNYVWAWQSDLYEFDLVSRDNFDTVYSEVSSIRDGQHGLCLDVGTADKDLTLLAPAHSLASATKATFVCVFKPDAITSNDAIYLCSNDFREGVSFWSDNLGSVTSNTNCFSVSFGTGTRVETATNSVVAGKWSTVVISYDGSGSVCVAIDGVSKTTLDLGSIPANLGSLSSERITLGDAINLSQFNGKIAFFAQSNKYAASTAECESWSKDVYSSFLKPTKQVPQLLLPPEERQVAWYPKAMKQLPVGKKPVGNVENPLQGYTWLFNKDFLTLDGVNLSPDVGASIASSVSGQVYHSTNSTGSSSTITLSGDFYAGVFDFIVADKAFDSAQGIHDFVLLNGTNVAIKTGAYTAFITGEIFTLTTDTPANKRSGIGGTFAVGDRVKLVVYWDGSEYQFARDGGKLTKLTSTGELDTLISLGSFKVNKPFAGEERAYDLSMQIITEQISESTAVALSSDPYQLLKPTKAITPAHKATQRKGRKVFK